MFIHAGEHPCLLFAYGLRYLTNKLVAFLLRTDRSGMLLSCTDRLTQGYLGEVRNLVCNYVFDMTAD